MPAGEGIPQCTTALHHRSKIQSLKNWSGSVEMRSTFGLVLSIAVLLFGCKKSGELKTVQTQKAGGYTIAILTDSGTMKSGANDFTLEFRRADNQLVDVGPVEVAPVMEMAGMAPMMGSSTVTAGDTPGRYHATGTLTMSGLWKFNVKFGGGQSVRISVNAE